MREGWSVATIVAALMCAALVMSAGAPAMACGTSCQCAPGERCDGAAGCVPAAEVSSPGAHPLCCSDPDCAPAWVVCENLDGSVGTCGAPGCVPHGCASVGVECGTIPDGCGGTVECGGCGGSESCVAGLCSDGCIPDCQTKACGEDGCGGTCGMCQPGHICSASGLCELCAPSCAGKSCGDDGCGGSCGSCPAGMACNDQFVCDICQAHCDGKECGDNGCGGSCGICPEGLFCSLDGLCVTCLPDCDGKECGPDGCGGLCGTCGFAEACGADGMCGCVADCLNRECGDNGCGGSCGSCGQGAACDAVGKCVPATTLPDVVVEPDGVGPDLAAEVEEPEPAADTGAATPETTADLLDCPPGSHLVWGNCVKDTEESTGGSDGGCQAGARGSAGALLVLLAGLLFWLAARRRGGDVNRAFSVALLSALLSLSACSETQVVSNGSDSAFDSRQDGPSNAGDLQSAGDGFCQPQCGDKQCGDDGCGDQCGTCPDGVGCENGLCTGTCKDDCSPAGDTVCASAGIQECGQFDGDGCLEWSEPRPCPGFGHCESGECVCVPDCLGKECGYDGCAGSCGTCPEGQQCVDYQCKGGCIDECPEAGMGHCTEGGRVVCGDYDDDGCLEWSEEQSCQGPCVEGECQCEPNCAGKECGPDGCGDQCGTCPPGQACKNYLCTSEGTECMPGAVDEQNCGNCGKRNRKCAADGTWSDWSDCLKEGVCKSGDQEEKACGKCGVQTRTCLAECQWGNWSYCVGEGMCAPGETQFEDCGLCGKQSRSCDNQCNWGTWTGCVGEGICTPGDEKVENCGNCGQRIRKCNLDCDWDPWGDCINQGQCSPGSTGTCGACGWQTCSPTCQWGPCQGEGECVPGTTSAEDCPTCRARECNDNCSWDQTCAVCAGCTQFTKCGTSCPSGYHAVSYSCSNNCGNCAWASDNQATCTPTCGNQITKCGTSCPGGYHAVNYSCSNNCGSCAWTSDNQATCQLTN